VSYKPQLYSKDKQQDANHYPQKRVNGG